MAQSTTAAQLQVIERLASRMGRAGIDHWLGGGWAIDFHLGRVTRDHSDVDFLVDWDNRSALEALLIGEGAVLSRSDEAGGVRAFQMGGVQIEITFLAKTQEGHTVTPGYESWPWPANSFGDQLARIGDRNVKVMSIEGLLDAKAGWEANFGEQPRPHDLADIEALRSLVAPSD